MHTIKFEKSKSDNTIQEPFLGKAITSQKKETLKDRKGKIQKYFYLKGGDREIKDIFRE